MFEIKQEHILKISQNELFQRGIKLCLENGFIADPSWFRGDPAILEKIQSLPKEEWYEKCLKNYSLAYLSPCENPDTYKPNSRNYHEVMRDFKDREDLIKLATDPSQPAWYCYYHYHQCDALAVFVLYPMIKLLKPDQEIYLHKGVMHTVLSLVDHETIKSARANG